MKRILTILILGTMFFNSFAQKNVYDKNNKKLPYIKEDVELKFSESQIVIPQKEGEELAALASLIPSAIDLGFKIATNSLEKRQKKFSGEYSTQNSYLEAGNKTIPNITFERKIILDSEYETALKIVLKAEKIDGIDGYYYYVESIDLYYSKAKTTGKSKMFDYTLEIKPTFYIDGEKKSQELHPISLSSIEFGENKFEKNKYRTDIIPLPKDGIFAEVSVKIIETNPAKVKADKILEIYNNYKDDAKTIINNFIKTVEPESSSDENGEDVDPNEGDGN